MNWDTLIGSVFTFVIAPLVGYLIGKFNERDRHDKSEEHAIRAGVRALLGFRIYDTWRNAKRVGYITIEEHAALGDIYTQYLALDGNGVGTERMKELGNLPHERSE